MTNKNTFLLYDTGHLMFAEANYERVLKNYISRINHVHCKDIRKDVFLKSIKDDLSFRESFLNGVFTVPGDGCIDYGPLVKILFECLGFKELGHGDPPGPLPGVILVDLLMM